MSDLLSRTNEFSMYESRWLAQHPEIYGRYLGEFIAVKNEKVIAHGKDSKMVLDKAKKLAKDFLYTYVYEDDVMIL